MAATTHTNGDELKPKVLVPEKLSPDGLAILRKTLQVDEVTKPSPSELLELIPNYEALLVRSETKVTAELLAAAKNLKVVARAGVGVDNVDVPAATKLGIVVVNSPSGNIQAAAEHTVSLLMSMARKIPEAYASVKAGKWERSKFVGVEVKGKVLGIIGLGKGTPPPFLFLSHVPIVRLQLTQRSWFDSSPSRSWPWYAHPRHGPLRVTCRRGSRQRDPGTFALCAPAQLRLPHHSHADAGFHTRHAVDGRTVPAQARRPCSQCRPRRHRRRRSSARCT